jgi:hypothetical protein
MRWRAVQFGVAVTLLLGFFLALLPPYGHAAVGLAAGFVGGALAGGGPRPGARHGLAVGVVGGLFALAVGALLAVSVGVTGAVPPVVAPLLPLSLGDAALTGVGAVAFAVCATLTGALGGWVRGDREFPGRIENERAPR